MITDWIKFDGTNKPVSPTTGLILAVRVAFAGSVRRIEFSDTFIVTSVAPSGYCSQGRRYTHWMPIEMPTIN